MPTPANRAKIQLARGNYANIAAGIADLVDGELCYARDQNKLYILSNNNLTPISSDGSGGGSIDPAYLLETIQDAIGSSITAGTNITVSYNDTTGKTTINSTASGTGGSTNLDGLTDVQIQSVLNNQILRYDSATAQWKNVTPNYLTSISASNLNAISVNALADVDTVSSAPQSGNVLSWNGTNWVPYSIPAESDTLHTVTGRGSSTTNNITVGKAFFKNTYNNLGDLPSASVNTGMFAEVAATGKAYYSTGGAWVELHSGVHNLNDLGDVDVTSTLPENNDVLAYDHATSSWKSKGFSIDGLTDVDTTSSSPITNNLLKYNGTKWVPSDISINNLNDVDTASVAPNSGDVLKYNSLTGQWVPGPAPSASVVLVPDAPSDGVHYLRLNNSWVSLVAALAELGIDAGQAAASPPAVNTSTSTTTGSSGTVGTYVPEAPDDGGAYVRKNSTWMTLQSALAEIGIDAGTVT